MSFWNDFNRLLNYRISYRIQNSFFNAFDNAQRAAKRAQRAADEARVMRDNSDELADLMYNNEYEKKRFYKDDYKKE